MSPAQPLTLLEGPQLLQMPGVPQLDLFRQQPPDNSDPFNVGDGEREDQGKGSEQI